MSIPQLRLVDDSAPGYAPETADPVRRIFEHWVWMHGKSVRRCKLGPERRQAIAAALALGYEVPDLLLAVEGHAADPMTWARDDDMRAACRDLDWLMVREKRIEAAIERGEALRADAARPEVRPAEEPQQQPSDPAEAQRMREKLRAMAAELRARGAR